MYNKNLSTDTHLTQDWHKTLTQTKCMIKIKSATFYEQFSVYITRKVKRKYIIIQYKKVKMNTDNKLCFKNMIKTKYKSKIRVNFQDIQKF